MRIYFKSLDLPKKAAKRIQKHFTPEHNLFEPMKLSHAQNIAALMLGYEDWHELETITKLGIHAPSLLDEEASTDEQRRRIEFQVEKLGMLQPQTEPLIRELVLKFRVSAGNPLSTKFDDDAYRKNTLLYWEPYGEDPEWRFRPSRRSEEARQSLYDLFEMWDRGEINFGSYEEKLQEYIKVQPENIIPYLYIICACEDIDEWDLANPYLDKLEAIIKNLIPSNYPLKKKVASLNWYTIDNRDYLRCLLYLGIGYYANRNYKKAKKWFLFLTRCSAKEIGYEKEYLIDLRRDKPFGDLHTMEERDIIERYYDPVTGKRYEEAEIAH